MTEGSGASAAARAAAETLNQLVWTVNAQNDTAGSFAAYASRFAEEHLDAAGLIYRFHVPPGLGDRALGAETRRQVYLAFKEAITNVVEHAHATEVHISIGIEGETLVVEVADDGCGFAAGSGDPTGIGLTGMRHRLEAVGGPAALTSAPGCGTRVLFRSPLIRRRPRPACPCDAAPPPRPSTLRLPWHPRRHRRRQHTTATTAWPRSRVSATPTPGPCASHGTRSRPATRQ